MKLSLLSLAGLALFFIGSACSLQPGQPPGGSVVPGGTPTGSLGGPPPSSSWPTAPAPVSDQIPGGPGGYRWGRLLRRWWQDPPWLGVAMAGWLKGAAVRRPRLRSPVTVAVAASAAPGRIRKLGGLTPGSGCAGMTAGRACALLPVAYRVTCALTASHRPSRRAQTSVYRPLRCSPLAVV